MNRKFNPIIAVGAVLLLAGVAVLAVLAGRGNSSDTSKVKALVATADVAAGTSAAAAAGSLKVQDVNSKDVPAGSPTSITAIAGSFATTKILKGQVITGNSFGQVASITPGAGLSLPKGKEGLGVELGFAPGGLRYVVPGNHINVYLAPKPNASGGSTAGRLLLPNLLVLRTTPGAGDGSGTAVTPGAGNLDFLLAVDPTEAKVLIGAASNAAAGSLYFTLSSTSAS
jgi:Flp pilus assembly protein CpaB